MVTRIASLALSSLLFAACAATTHAVKPATMGTVSRSSAMLAVIDQPGPLEVETVNSADWAVPRSGLINLDSDKAKAAHLTDGDEPIQVFFHVIRHPTRGTYLVDTGIERALRDAPEKSAFGSLVRSVMHLEKLHAHEPLADWIASQPQPPAGVFMTHLHLDHIAGMRDLPRGTPIFTGPGEPEATIFMNLFTQGDTNRALEGQAPLQEWPATPDADGRFAGVIDVFGDGSLWAIWVPGHTAGSMAYLARTTKGPVLLAGDTSHTAWGWKEGVEPGSFTADRAKNADSLARLEKLVVEHPGIDVRLGHQYLNVNPESARTASRASSPELQPPSAN